MPRFLGIDVGAEALKVVELRRDGAALSWTRRALVEHHAEPGRALLALLAEWGYEAYAGAAVTGRFARQVGLVRVPSKQALARGHRFLCGEAPATVVSIGSHGFQVLELRGGGSEVWRENGRCSQGTGNFLRQLVDRFGLGIEEASALATPVEKPAPLSGRCPVILKTDMTHLANKGEDRARILAGLFDAVCENVQVLVKPRLSPPRTVLVGGVSLAPRVRAHFARFLARHGGTLTVHAGDDARFVEALGSALVAAERQAKLPPLGEVLLPAKHADLERVPAPSAALSRVRRMAPPPAPDPAPARRVLLGLDIGSTGSKAVLVDTSTREVVWEGYLRTGGDPVGAALALVRQLLASPAKRHAVVGLGVTGSGRDIVGSLLSTCYGEDLVFVLNEIAAHAAGALHYDPRVDTIFEIGGQDAKYVRLAGGRVIDAAMNEACSAGTGSFIEEQGRKLTGAADVGALGDEAMGATSGVSLGQHCSVFMAEIIDEAVAAGVEQPAIVAGIYDSVIQNYLNRVKGSRSVGQVIFCQGMPFSADALAAAVARQTGSEVIVPPNPGNVGALGIALLALAELPSNPLVEIDFARFLGARVERKDVFVCKATQGCGGAGNACRIDRLGTVVEGKRQRFTWGGGCSLWDKGTRRRKLPDLAPDPFRERAELARELIAEVTRPTGARKVALTDEFALKGLFPFFATFLRGLGLDLVVRTGADQKMLKRGIEGANLPLCAPMQQYHGLASTLAEDGADWLFLPMLRTLPRTGDERHAVVCPIVQGSPDLLRLDLGKAAPRVLSPVVDFSAEGLEGGAIEGALADLARSVGVPESTWRRAHLEAMDAQRRFDARCLALGRQALAFAREHGLPAIVVLGRPYTIHNQVLNSNVPAILREQGVIAIPMDCHPPDGEAPTFEDMYWAQGQRILRAAHQVKREPGVYPVYCSNYSCGPDSFNLHFYAYLMEGKPFAVIETDGHSGDAGTKTRMEAFLHCVREDLARGNLARAPAPLERLSSAQAGLPDIRRRGERLLIPRMGPSAEALGACLRGVGVDAETLPMADRDALRLGRRHTSGKECIPMAITLGSLLARIEREADPHARFAFFMPTASGPCRFGVYNTLHKIVLERLGLDHRVRVWSPSSNGYFDGMERGFSILVFLGFLGADLLLELLHDVRPAEREAGTAQAIYQRYHAELLGLLERAARGDLSIGGALLEAASGRNFGVTELLGRAARELAAVKDARPMPAVLVVGEIYVRCDPFANDFVVERLEERGLRVRFAPFSEWIEYTDLENRRRGRQSGLGAEVSALVQARIRSACYAACARPMRWPARTSVEDSLEAAAPYLRSELEGEAVLTVGGPLHEWRHGHIDAMLSVGPLECMPNKIAEAQLFHAGEREGLLSLTLALSGDPIDPEVLDRFAFEVHERFRSRPARSRPGDAARPGRLGRLAETANRLTAPARATLRSLPVLRG